MSRSGEHVLTIGDVYLAECPDSCALGLHAVEGTRTRADAVTALAEATGWPEGQLRVTRLTRAAARRRYREIAANRDGCPHARKDSDS